MLVHGTRSVPAAVTELGRSRYSLKPGPADSACPVEAVTFGTFGPVGSYGQLRPHRVSPPSSSSRSVAAVGAYSVELAKLGP